VLGGGGLTPVVRVGATVRRATGEWTPAVHALLRHLESAGFAGAPGVLGIDDEGREVVTFIAGGAEAHDDRALADVARLIRAYHDAVAGFRPPADSRWQFMVGAPREGAIVCHNDLAPANTIYRTGRPCAFVDWDLAAPGSRIWDVAYAVWRFVPLYPDEDCARLGFPVRPRGPRMRLLCDAYGLDSRETLLDVVRARQQSLYDTAREWGEAGRPGWREVWRDTRGEQWLRSIRYLDENREAWQRSL
jgi:Phosphotransferase enzyme family